MYLIMRLTANPEVELVSSRKQVWFNVDGTIWWICKKSKSRPSG